MAIMLLGYGDGCLSEESEEGLNLEKCTFEKE